MAQPTIVVIGAGLSALMFVERVTQELLPWDIIILEAQPIQNFFNWKDVHSFHLHETVPTKFVHLVERQFQVGIYHKGQYHSQNNIILNNLYAMKVLGSYARTTIYQAGDKGWIPIYVPEDSAEWGILNTMKRNMHAGLKNMPKVTFNFGLKVTEISKKDSLVVAEYTDEEEEDCEFSFDFVVNTIPLPKFLEIPLGRPVTVPVTFENFPFICYSARISNIHNLYQMLYIPDRMINFNRIVILNNRIFVELPPSVKEYEFREQDITMIKSLMGIEESKFDEERKTILLPGRFKPIPREARKKLQRYLTDTYNIFSLGRYATWDYRVASVVWNDAGQIIETIKSKMF